MRRLMAVLLICLATTAPAAELGALLDVLVAAYPDHLARHDGKEVIWQDGTRMPASDGREHKSFEELLEAPSLADQFRIPYPLGTALKVPGFNEDPGRIRHEPFFRKMYGDCRRREVERHLQPVRWLPDRDGGTVRVTTVNHVADRLRAVARDLDALSTSLSKYLVPSAGTYHCRPIAGTTRLSMHAYGTAIDLNARFGDYWLWARGKDGTFAWKNRIPPEIVEVFERHGFVWGGKWYHFDTLHFEYRPEIIAFAQRRRLPR